MARIENTAFVSYRRKDISWALAVYQYLTHHRYDVFFDFASIPSGDFEQIILTNIKARAHFLVILTPNSFDRCDEPGDWFRREIETAIQEKRNIIPLFLDGFNFGSPLVSDKLTGRLATIRKYNGLDVPGVYFTEAMDRVRERFLNVALDALLHPVPDEVQQAVEKEQTIANKATLHGNGGYVIYSFGDMEFVKVQASESSRGSNNEIRQSHDDQKQHTVNIPYDYYMARFTITNKEYDVYVRAKEINHPVSNWEKKSNHPVENVSWNDAMSYCRWLNELLRSELPSGLILRLPTEAEWEKAACWKPFPNSEGQSASLIYPWGNTFDEHRCNTSEGGRRGTTPVGTYSPQGDSPYGCTDMSGNIWEWTHSLFRPYPYEANDGRENEIDSGRRVLRGGSFDLNKEFAHCAYRLDAHANGLYIHKGFRVVIAPPIF